MNIFYFLELHIIFFDAKHKKVIELILYNTLLIPILPWNWFEAFSMSFLYSYFKTKILVYTKLEMDKLNLK